MDSSGLKQVLTGRSVAELHALFRQRVRDDGESLADRLCLSLLEADLRHHANEIAHRDPPQGGKRIAIVSLLFNWPSTGGGIVHTAELAKFLSVAGLDVCHFYAVYAPWQIGDVRHSLPYTSEALLFSEKEWNAASIKDRYRGAVARFSPDCVIVTDSWNSKLLLAEA